jgi:type VI secretion system protein VasD
MTRPASIVRGLLVLAALCLAACGPSHSLLRATVKADDKLNPDAGGRPSPVVVRLFELKSPRAFESADFYSLYQREQEALGPDLVVRDEIVVKPGETLKFDRVLQDATTDIGLVAAFRDIEHAQWKAAKAIRRNKKTKVTVRLEASSISTPAK